MVSTREAVHELIDALDECLFHQEDIWEGFARDYETKARLLSGIVELALSLTEMQVEHLGKSPGEDLPAAALTAEQQVILAAVEPLMRALGLLNEENGQILAEAALDFRGNGQMWFGWGELPHRTAIGLSWLPDAVYNRTPTASLSEVLEAWRDRKEWLVEEHAEDARRATERCRLAFRLAMSTTTEQVAWMVARNGLPVTALEPEQRALLEAAARLHPRSAPGEATHSFVSFDVHGQFWLLQRGATRTSRCSLSWLPDSWRLPDQESREWLRREIKTGYVLRGATGRAERLGRPIEGSRSAREPIGVS